MSAQYGSFKIGESEVRLCKNVLHLEKRRMGIVANIVFDERLARDGQSEIVAHAKIS
jgi:hypothetical protein